MSSRREHAESAIAGLTSLIASAGIADPALVQLTAQGEVALIIKREALTLAFDDVFRLMALLFVGCWCRSAASPNPCP